MVDRIVAQGETARQLPPIQKHWKEQAAAMHLMRLIVVERKCGLGAVAFVDNRGNCP